MTERRSALCYTLVAIAVSAFWLVSGCSASREIEQLTVVKRFERALSLFKEENYLEAYEEFRIVTLQYQGSAVADEAQYLMGECRFRREEYVLAAYEYDVLNRTMPTSKYVPQARYQRAFCYYKLSPSYHLDQNYTRQAIDEFQSFIEYHPTDSLVVQAEVKISELNSKLALKTYENGIIYIRMEYYKSALSSFDYVLEKYHDTPYAEQAQFKKAEVQLLRNRVNEAKTEIEKFFSKYPNSLLKADAEQLQKKILSRPPQKPSEKAKSTISSSGR